MAKANPNDRFNVRVTREKISMYINSLIIDAQGSPLRIELIRAATEAMRYDAKDAKQVSTMANAWLGFNTNTDIIPAVDRRVNRKDRRRS